MSEQREHMRLRHMLDYAREAVALVQGRKRADLDDDHLLELALVRLLKVVGEAASRVPVEDRALYPDILWPQIVGLHNRSSTATMQSTRRSSGRSSYRICPHLSRRWKRSWQNTTHSKRSDWRAQRYALHPWPVAVLAGAQAGDAERRQEFSVRPWEPVRAIPGIEKPPGKIRKGAALARVRLLFLSGPTACLVTRRRAQAPGAGVRELGALVPQPACASVPADHAR